MPNYPVRHQILKDITLPRQIAEQEFAVHRLRHARDLLAASLETSKMQASLRLVQAEQALEQQQQAFKKLQADREALIIRAPVRGHAFAGHYDQGWKSVTPGLKVGDRVAAQQVLFSIVQAAPKLVRTSIAEADYLRVRVGQAATLHPVALDGVSLPALVHQVAPYARDGKHTVWLTAQTRHEHLLPGNTCRVELPLID